MFQLRRPRLYHGVCGLPQRMFEDGDHVIEGYSFEDGDFKSGAGQDVVEVKDASLTMVSASAAPLLTDPSPNCTVSSAFKR